MFVVICGGDGAGKSTLLSTVASLRPAWHTGSYQPHDWLPHPDLTRFSWALETHPKAIVANLDDNARAAFLVDMICAHAHSWLGPRLAERKTVVLDSYHFRFRAREQVRGVDTAQFDAAIATLPVPNLVVMLAVEPAVALSRKADVESHELRRSSRPGQAPQATDLAFITFQTAVGEAMRVAALSSGASVVEVDASCAPDVVADRVLSEIEALCKF